MWWLTASAVGMAPDRYAWTLQRAHCHRPILIFFYLLQPIFFFALPYLLNYCSICFHDQLLESFAPEHESISTLIYLEPPFSMGGWVQCPTPAYNHDSSSWVPSEPTLGGAINIIFSDAPISCQPIWQPNLGYFLYQLVPGKIMWGHQSHGNGSLVEDREVEVPVKSRLLMTSPNSQLCTYHHLFFFLRYPSKTRLYSITIYQERRSHKLQWSRNTECQS